MTRLNIFIGFDERELDVYRLCEQSIRRHCKTPDDLHIEPLYHKDLRLHDKVFDRPWLIDGKTGQYVDMVDKRPFSTQFAHSRFLVPALAKMRGLKGWAVFVDCDFIFRDDVNKLFDQLESQPDKSICVVKHQFESDNTEKMDRVSQKNYGKKLWSSHMAFNLKSPYNSDLTPTYVNSAMGMDLHQFRWLPDDSYIGEIDERWNFIPDHSEPRVDIKNLGAIHYTEGGPWFKGREECKYSDIYWDEWNLWLEESKQSST